MGQVLGALLGLMMVMMGIPVFLQYQSQAAENQRMATTAQQASQINEAVQSYLVINSVSLEASATATAAATITLPMLQGAGLLPSGFSGTNPYGQSWNIQVLQPSAGNLQALVSTSGGVVLSDRQGSSLAALIGAAGGFLPQNDSGIFPAGAGTAVGAYGGWSLATGNYSNMVAGHLASWVGFSNNQATGNYLWRNAVPGQPQFNTMNTPLILNTVQTLGTNCNSTGAIAQDGTGVLLSCQGGLWQGVGGAWKSPVSSYAALPLVGNTTGDVRLTNDVQRAYAWNGVTWVPLAADQNGNLTVNDVYLRATGKWLSQSMLPPWICVQYQSYWASGILQDHNFSVFFSSTNQSAGSEGNGWMVVCGVS